MSGKAFNMTKGVLSFNGRTGAVVPKSGDYTAADVGAAPEIEDSNNPGCYYRMNNGVQEWVNPPMKIGTEYRTTERYNGKPVYVKLFSTGVVPSSAGVYSYTYSDDTSCRPFFVSASVGVAAYSGGMQFTMPNQNALTESPLIWAWASINTVKIVNSGSVSQANPEVLVKYIKTTD